MLSSAPAWEATRTGSRIAVPAETVPDVRAAVDLIRSLDLPGVWAPVAVEERAGEAWLTTSAPPGPTLADLLAAAASITPLDAAGLVNEVGQTLLALRRAGRVHAHLTAESVVPGSDGIARLRDAPLWLVAADSDVAPDAARWAQLTDRVGVAWGGAAASGFQAVAEVARGEGIAAGLARLGAMARGLSTPGDRRASVRAAVAQNLPTAGPLLPRSVSGATRPSRRSMVVGDIRTERSRETCAGAEIRFGPGVAPLAPTAAVPSVARPERGPIRRRRRLLGMVGVLAGAALAALVWWWLHRTEPIAVSRIEAWAVPASLGCGETAEVRATVHSNGEPGALTYRWMRSDGTVGEVRTERLADGQKTATLVLHWQVIGGGRFHGVATVQVLAPTRDGASAAFDYAC